MTLIFVLVTLWSASSAEEWMSKEEMKLYRERAKAMFYHGYENYLEHAYPFDELKPLSCSGQDTWGSYSLTLIDALDTLLIMGNETEFRRVAQLLEDTISFDDDINISVFETNIRVVGGLLSAHLLSYKAGMQLEQGWPCEGPLLRLAVEAAEKLLPAFRTNTSMPYGTVNMQHGVPKGETSVTCTASIGTFVLEFGTLTYLTGDNRFMTVAMDALDGLWKSRSSIGLVGNHINVQTGAWVALDAGIGAGVDSYFEYLVKGATLFANPTLLDMFKQLNKDLKKHLKYNDWYLWGNMENGKITLPIFQSLEAYWPGVQVMLGHIGEASRTFYNYYQVWRQFGATPEFYDLGSMKSFDKKEGYPLRPELIESAVYLYQATKDPFFLNVGRDAIESLERISKTKCGYASIKNVNSHELEDRMESFFLAETTKYLYLLFDDENFIHNDSVKEPYNDECFIGSAGYVFNTEAHPIDIAAVRCCPHKHSPQSDYFAKSLSAKDGCKRRAFHHKLYGLGTYLGDEDNVFHKYPKEKHN